MDRKINLSQLADLLAQAGGMSKTAAEQFVRNFFDIISQSVLTDGLVKVKGLGTFKLLQMEDRESVNVNTGERFTIEGHQKISFTPDAELKERINKPFAAFETVIISEEQADELAKMDKESTTEKSVLTPGAVGVKSQESVAEQAKEPVADEKSEPAQVRDVQEYTAGDNTVDNKEEEKKPVVRDITQSKGSRCLLKFIVWFLSIILVVALALYLLWPIIGNKVLTTIERTMNDRNKTEQVADSSSTQTAPAVIPEMKPEEKPEAEPETKPAQENRPSENARPAQSVARPAATSPQVAAPAVKTQTLQLTAEDQAKGLEDFTEADVVNYIIDGELTVHELRKGETITRLALRYYGSKKLWPYIVKYNDIKDAAKLSVGDKIRIPVLKNK